MTVINCRHDSVPESAVQWIMRGSPFGNPFRIGRDGDRESVIAQYRRWLYVRLRGDPKFRAAVQALHGKTLVCGCKPLPCHGDVLERAADWLNGPDAAQIALV